MRKAFPGWIDYAAVKPVISDFQVDTGIYHDDNETADADIVLEVKAERGSTFVIENNGSVGFSISLYFRGIGE